MKIGISSNISNSVTKWISYGVLNDLGYDATLIERDSVNLCPFDILITDTIEDLNSRSSSSKIRYVKSIVLIGSTSTYEQFRRARRNINGVIWSSTLRAETLQAAIEAVDKYGQFTCMVTQQRLMTARFESTISPSCTNLVLHLLRYPDVSYDALGEALNVSSSTVQRYMNQLFTLFNVSSRAGVIASIYENQLFAEA